jgi:hypothetical protein
MNETQLNVVLLEIVELDSLRFIVELSRPLTEKEVSDLDDVLVGWHRVGVYGGFGGRVHNVRRDLEHYSGERVVEFVVDAGSAPWESVETLIRCLDGLRRSGLPLQRALIGWRAGE